MSQVVIPQPEYIIYEEIKRDSGHDIQADKGTRTHKEFLFNVSVSEND